MRTTRRALLAAAALCLTTLASPAAAQTWPTRPVKFIVSLGPGSGADLGARIMADRLATRWGQPVVVENRPGGDAVIAINAFIGARDDHVLLYTPTSAFTAHPYQHDKLPYDPSELAPIARVSNTLVGFVVAPALNIASVGELIALVRARPNELNYATGTGMTDLIYEGYFKGAGLAITRVAYRDVVAPMADLGENRIQAYAGGLGILQPHVDAGRAKLVAVTNSQRAPMRPDVPTVAEAGFPALTFDGLVGVFGPRDMASAARERIAADIRAELADPALKARLAATGAAVLPAERSSYACSRSSTGPGPRKASTDISCCSSPACRR